MCRFVAYIGHPILMDSVLVKPANSIVMQSLSARETSIPTNGDGFGLGWYSHDISSEPALFTSLFPAWSDRNFLHLTSKIKSSCFFAHVRAASIGGLNTYNCHPFVHGNWMLMHNGELHDFISIKRHLRHLLDNDIYNHIRGETDSEHIFALFLQKSKGKDLNHLSEVVDVLHETILEIKQLIQKHGRRGTSFFNICLTDGQRMVATRYCTDKKQSLTLHYTEGSSFMRYNDPYWMVHEGEKKGGLLISSEKLTDINADWHEVPVNHLLLVDRNGEVALEKARH